MSQECWSEETVVHHLVTLFEELAEAFRRQHLPTYFMSKVNLLQDVDPQLSLNFLEKISKLSHNFTALSDALDAVGTGELILTDCEMKRIDNLFDVMDEEIQKVLTENKDISCALNDMYVNIY